MKGGRDEEKGNRKTIWTWYNSPGASPEAQIRWVAAEREGLREAAVRQPTRPQQLVEQGGDFREIWGQSASGKVAFSIPSFVAHWLGTWHAPGAVLGLGYKINQIQSCLQIAHRSGIPAREAGEEVREQGGFEQAEESISGHDETWGWTGSFRLPQSSGFDR